MCCHGVQRLGWKWKWSTTSSIHQQQDISCFSYQRQIAWADTGPTEQRTRPGSTPEQKQHRADWSQASPRWALSEASPPSGLTEMSLPQVWNQSMISAAGESRRSSSTPTSSSWCSHPTGWMPSPPPAGASGRSTPITASSKAPLLSLLSRFYCPILHKYGNTPSWTSRGYQLSQ